MGFLIFLVIVVVIGLIIFFVRKAIAAAETADYVARKRNEEKIITNIMSGASCENCGNHSSNCKGLPNPCGLWEKRI